MRNLEERKREQDAGLFKILIIMLFTANNHI